jgi:hypothetical protein
VYLNLGTAASCGFLFMKKLIWSLILGLQLAAAIEVYRQTSEIPYDRLVGILLNAIAIYETPFDREKK